MSWFIELLFWPAMILSTFTALIGIKLLKPVLLIVSGILIIPLSLYLTASPKFSLFGLSFPLFYWGAAALLRTGRKWPALLSSLPVFILLTWLAYVVNK